MLWLIGKKMKKEYCSILRLLNNFKSDLELGKIVRSDNRIPDVISKLELLCLF